MVLDVFGDLFVCFVWCGYCGCCFLLLRCEWLLFAVRAGDLGCCLRFRYCLLRVVFGFISCDLDRWLVCFM